MRAICLGFSYSKVEKPHTKTQLIQEMLVLTVDEFLQERQSHRGSLAGDNALTLRGVKSGSSPYMRPSCGCLET